ncbi:hypothetical protein DSM104635_00142 [Terricaulis silvestris]|uniref:Uncharacterized protein n=1 Tax=Terricaulis silvestris TaxID=2686094 RepID=A0A6I6MP53_9CAUL|nr:hypothetical protein DSM104635_00142 [Terricaulis silvestris]
MLAEPSRRLAGKTTIVRVKALQLIKKLRGGSLPLQPVTHEHAYRATDVVASDVATSKSSVTMLINNRMRSIDIGTDDVRTVSGRRIRHLHPNQIADRIARTIASRGHDVASPSQRSQRRYQLLFQERFELIHA